MIKELSLEAAHNLLSEQKTARLGCVLACGDPYVIPVNYLYKDGLVIIHSFPGLKIDALRANSKACIQIDSIKNIFNWQSVIAFGDFEEITGKQEREELLKEITERFQNLTPVEAVKHETHDAAGMVLFAIRIRRISGLIEN